VEIGHLIVAAQTKELQRLYREPLEQSKTSFLKTGIHLADKPARQVVFD
jgi:hypothetical protein